MHRPLGIVGAAVVSLLLAGPLTAAPAFVRGDADGTGALDVTDAIRVFFTLFIEPEDSPCPDAADANDDGEIDLSDGIFILSFGFLGGPQPPAPFPLCGPDPTSDPLLPCVAYTGCDGGPGPSTFLVGLRNRPAEPRYQYFVVTSDTALVAQCRDQLALPEEERALHVSGRLARGDGGFNAPWSWHIAPDEWGLAELSIELCDGLPEHVEDDLEYWIDTVRFFCSWSSFIRADLTPVPIAVAGR